MGYMSLQTRESLPSKSFAIPSRKAKKIGVEGQIQGKAKGKYPIPDLKHARNALARVSQFGSPEEREAVRRKVYSKYPELKEGFKMRHGVSPTSKKHIRAERMGGIGKAAMAAFCDEFTKIAALNPTAISRAMKAIGRSSGEMGKKMVPKAKPMTAYFRGGKMIKVPHGSPPPLPMH